MLLADQIKTARTPQEALLLLAQAIDAVNARLDAAPADPWEQPLQWDDGTPVSNGSTIEFRDGSAQALHEQKIAATRAQLAACHDPEEQRALEAQLRLLTDKGQSLQSVVPDGVRPTIESDGTTGEVDFTAVSEDRQIARQEWAQQHRLWEFLAPLTMEQTLQNFGKGGPMWLYLGNRKAIMEMPYEWRQWLVTEVAQDSERDAQEMGRDVLKSIDSTDRSVTEQAIEGLNASRGV